MKIRYLIFTSIIFSIIFILGCLEQQQKNKNKSDSLAKLESNTATNVEQLSAGELKAKIDCLEKLFNNDNYYFINKRDTQYLYFTRTNEESIYTHQYKMLHGDSTHLNVDTIQQNQNRIVWNWNGQIMILDSVTNQTARWINENEKATYEFNKNNEGMLLMTINGKQKIALIKTPQISLFLSRSFYDYKNGTHFAFDTSNFTKKR